MYSIELKVLHGIVDSIWVKKKEYDENNTILTKERQQKYYYDDYLELKKSIQRETGFDISFEGIYKWIVFVNSKIDNYRHNLPVPNRYFGVFEDGILKVRGIEERRHILLYFYQNVREILKLMAIGNSINEVKTLMPSRMLLINMYDF